MKALSLHASTLIHRGDFKTLLRGPLPRVTIRRCTLTNWPHCRFRIWRMPTATYTYGFLARYSPNDPRLDRVWKRHHTDVVLAGLPASGLFNCRLQMALLIGQMQINLIHHFGT